MPRRKELKGLARDLSTSFNSRNNDYLGYWAIGHICQVAESAGEDIVTLDLITSCTSPNKPLLIEICGSMNRHLMQTLQSHRLSETWLEKATFEIRFNEQHRENNHRQRSTFGSPYISILKLTSDLGAEYETITGGHCSPHDSERERRRFGY